MGGQAALRIDERPRINPRFSSRRAAVATKIEFATLTQALERGIENVTVEEVAVAAGVSRRTFYRYFRTIEDALCAMAKRSVARLAEALSTRPLSENIFQALIQVGRTLTVSPEDAEIQKLANQLAHCSPDAWWRAINSAGVGASEGMEPVVAARLAATGEDVSRAGVITAVYLAVVAVVGRKNLESAQLGTDPQLVEGALRDVADFMHAALSEPGQSPGSGLRAID